VVDNCYSDKIAELFGQLVIKGQFLEFPQLFVSDVYMNDKLLKSNG
jgi:hypothetical protein